MRNLKELEIRGAAEIQEVYREIYQESGVGAFIKPELYKEYSQLLAHRLNHRGESWHPPSYNLFWIRQIIACEIFPNLDEIHIAPEERYTHEDLREMHGLPQNEPRISGDLLHIIVDGEPYPNAIKIDTRSTPIGAKRTTEQIIEDLKSAGYVVFGPAFQLL